MSTRLISPVSEVTTEARLMGSETTAISPCAVVQLREQMEVAYEEPISTFSHNDVMTAAEVSKFLSLDIRTVIKRASDGTIPGIKLGKQWRFSRSELVSTSSSKDVMTAGEVAELLRLHIKNVIKFAVDGTIPGIKLGKQWRFNRPEIARLMNSGTKGAMNR